MRILILGGTGFIGRHLVARLSAAGHALTLPTRRLAHGRDLLVHPTATVLEADIHDEAVIAQLLPGHDAVINLVGILHSQRGKPYGADFERVHVLLPRRVAYACRTHGIGRFLHLSALGASPSGPSMYLRSKGDGETAIRAAFQSPGAGSFTLMRPSVVFGPDDNFLNLFGRLARWFPVLPVGGAKARMQPVYVEDLVLAMQAALTLPAAAGATYEVVGPHVYTLGELVSLAAAAAGHPRPVIALPDALARAQAMFFECLPGDPLVSRDNLDSLTVDNVATRPLSTELGVVPTPLEAVLAQAVRRKGEVERRAR
ncbi:NAD-dependent epimerase/dehydratase [plant metagenome]|uniref:NAD-dependent epimerase/dehydratase n=1 Tax=plant metagenome TaxID=1297885 RepID=A0A484R8H3_9ZZZZ